MPRAGHVVPKSPADFVTVKVGFHRYLVGYLVDMSAVDNAAGDKPAGMFLFTVMVSISHLHDS